MSKIAEVFADAALAYQERLSQGDVVLGTSMAYNRGALVEFYSARSKELEAMLSKRPLVEVCMANHIGREGQRILAKEIERILDRESGR